MSTYDWLLLVHVLGAVAVVAALVAYTAGLLGALRSERPSEVAAFLQLARPGGMLFDVGGSLLLVFGVWLAIDADYGVTDEWVLAALALWVIAALAGTRTRIRFLGARDRAAELARDGDTPSSEGAALLRDSGTLVLYGVAVTSVLAMLALMIFKPGAG